MKFSNFVETASRVAHKAMFKVKKHSPEILIAVGAVGIVAGTVAACKATLKVPPIVEEADKTLEMIHGVQDGTLEIPEGGFTLKTMPTVILSSYMFRLLSRFSSSTPLPFCSLVVALVA